MFARLVSTTTPALPLRCRSVRGAMLALPLHRCSVRGEPAGREGGWGGRAQRGALRRW